MLVSMTGFAARRGEGAGCDWAWDIRSVNGKGFDLRLRLPEGVEGLEQGARAAVARVVARGNVSLNLRLQRGAGGGAMALSPSGLAANCSRSAVTGSCQKGDSVLRAGAGMMGSLQPMAGDVYH